MPSWKWFLRHRAPEREQQFKLIVGLGNPGQKYANSRHNAGFLVVDRFAQANSLEFRRRRFNAFLAEGEIAGRRVIVGKPQAFMNSSGDAVGKLYSFYHIAPQDLLVVYDDLDLPLGMLRLRARGSAGGHHGMESIIARIGTSDFPRLRVGIGRPNPDADIDHVLGTFEPAERSIVDETLARAADAIRVWLDAGIDAAMNQFN